jgi:hypothetical protein
MPEKSKKKDKKSTSSEDKKKKKTTSTDRGQPLLQDVELENPVLKGEKSLKKVYKYLARKQEYSLLTPQQRSLFHLSLSFSSKHQDGSKWTSRKHPIINLPLPVTNVRDCVSMNRTQ